MDGRLGVNFSRLQQHLTSQSRLRLAVLIEVRVIRVEWVTLKLTLECFVVRPVALDVPVGGEFVLFKCLPYFVLFCIIIYCQA